MAEKKSKITNVEHGLVIGALAAIDFVQLGLDLAFEIGVAINRFIDVFVGLAYGFYLQIRGQSLANPKRLMGIVGTFFAEEIPDVDALPFWCLDGVYNMILIKREEAEEEEKRKQEEADKKSGGEDLKMAA